MAAMSSLKDLLPDGFRLNPRDEDLIYYYLWRKLQNIPDPDGHCLIPELNIYSFEPRDLITAFNDMASIRSNGLECFFFSHLYKDPNRGCNKRKIAGGKNGFWHQTGEGRQPQPTDKLPWAKRIFCHRTNSEQTDWVMHEFRLISDERFVLCRITKKPKKLFSASTGKKRKVCSTDHIESHQETSPEVTKKKPRNKKPNKLSASAGKKRKGGSTDDSESHQETSPESCVLNDIITKKAKNKSGPSQNDKQTPQAAGSEASVHTNAIESPWTPHSDIITSNDLDKPLLPTMDVFLPPLYDCGITSQTQNDNQTPPQVAGSEVQASSVHINAIESPSMCMTTFEDIFASNDLTMDGRLFSPLYNDYAHYMMDIQPQPLDSISDDHVDTLREIYYWDTLESSWDGEIDYWDTLESSWDGEIDRLFNNI